MSGLRPPICREKRAGAFPRGPRVLLWAKPTDRRGGQGMEQIEGLEKGTKVIIYTLIMRGSAQTSYVGVVLAVSGTGLTIDAASGRTFFPWNAIERVTY